MRSEPCWLVLIDHEHDLSRRPPTLTLDEMRGGPLSPGDHVAIAAWASDAAKTAPSFRATADVKRSEGPTTRIRRRVAAVPRHEVALFTLLPELTERQGWSARRGPHPDQLFRITKRQFETIERTLLEIALRFGPRPTRPSHDQPRTPGRRALIKGMASVRGSHA